VSDKKLLPIGTRIRFIKSLYGAATGDSPPCVYAEKGDGGVVTGYNNFEGHWVKWDHWPHAFGAEYGTEFVEEQQKPSPLPPPMAEWNGFDPIEISKMIRSLRDKFLKRSQSSGEDLRGEL
jgi:hypothetical protein